LPLHDPGVIELSATVPVGKPIEVVRDRMIQIVEGLAKSKITDEELARFRAKTKKRFKLAFANSSALAVQLSEMMAAGDWRLMFLIRDQIAKLKPADVERVAAQYLRPTNRTVGIFTPTKDIERAPLKQTPDFKKVVGDYKGQPPEADGEKFDATLDNIEKRTTRAALANGMKLTMLPKITRGHVVRARLTMRYGSEADFTGKRLAASAIDDMLTRGTKKRTFQQIKDQFDLLEAQVGFTSQPGLLDVSIQTTRDNFPAVLALVNELLRESTFPQEQFDIMVKENVTALEDAKSDPQAQAFTTVSRTVTPYAKNHPLYTPTTQEQIDDLKKLKVAELKKWPAMFGMSNATLAIIGDVDAAATKAWVEKTWGTWKSPKPWKRLERKFFPSSTQDVVLDFPDKASALIASVHSVEMKDDDADAPAMMAANYTLGGGGFVSRLTTRLRQKDGLSYLAFSVFQLVPLDASGVFVAGGAMNPENVKKGRAALDEEITKFATTGITAEELDGAKKGLAGGFERNLSNDATVLTMLADGTYLDRTMDYWKKQQAAIQALTVDVVNTAIKKRFKPGTLIKINAGDKKKM
jgi:zinc protease